MGSTWTAWIVMVAAALGCTALGWLLGLPAPPPASLVAGRAAGGSRRLECPTPKGPWV